jgi:predicted helicase
MNTQIELLKHKIAAIPDSGNERSFYPALCNFLEEYGKITLKLRAPQAVAEESLSKDDKNIGFPDITVRNGQNLIGWIEVKLPGDNLDSDKFKVQFSKYKDSLENIVFTNLRDWELWQWAKEESEGKVEPKQVARVFFDITKVDGVDSVEFENFLAKFFEGRAYETRTPKQLALALAKKTRLLSKQVEEAVEITGRESDLSKLKDTFERTLIQDISSHQFANMVAETMAYSLFLSALEHDRRGNGNELTLTNAIDYLPTNVPILADLYDLIKRIAGIIPNIHQSAQLLVDQINASEIERIRQKLVEHKPGEDPVIQFYEPFLAEYDPKEREARGVYYTPKPVVDYIVRSVDWILRSKFGKEKGLGDETVNLLDPATGTGTFLMSAIQQIYWGTKKANESLGDEMVSREFNKIVLNHILKHFYGFELLIAPYAIAHLKLTLEIERLGFDFELSKKDEDSDNDRFKVYLANTLDDPNKPPQKLFGFDSIPEESAKAQQVKRDIPILAIIGNPPYSGTSMNMQPSMRALVEKYKFVDGVKIKERGALQMEKNLNDDYVKFISFAQERINKNGSGVVAFITNNGYLDNPTLPGLRKSLLDTFDELYFLNLFGSTKKSDHDDSVFNISLGTAICFLIKYPDSHKKEVFYQGVKGAKLDKFDYLVRNDISTTKWDQVTPKMDRFLFIRRDERTEDEYFTYLPLKTIFKDSSIGLITARDNLVVQFEKKDVLSSLGLWEDSQHLDDASLCAKLGISAKKGWSIAKAKKDYLGIKTRKEDYIRRLIYKPFDDRWIFYHKSLVWSMSYPTMRHLQDESNLVLLFPRQAGGDNYPLFVGNKIFTGRSVASVASITYGAPLYIQKEEGTLLKTERVPNISENAAKTIGEKIGLTYSLAEDDLSNTFGPRDIFYYTYAILHSPTYRSRYAEQLKLDFPRVPVTSDKRLFKQLVFKGNELVNLHLLGENPLDSSKTIFDDSSRWDVKIGSSGGANLESWKVTDVRYNEKEQRVYVNSDQYFDGVSKDVWDFMIGGYKVCEKWLKERKKAGRSLSTDDLKHYMKIVVALRETIRVMKEIDAAIPKWPLQ